MTEAMRRLGAPPGEEGGLAASLPTWQPFPEAAAALDEARDRGWRLAILSNSDPDQIAASKALLGVPIDETVVAGEIGSYKPNLRHWHEFSARTLADPARHVHVGASLFHDIAPAVEARAPVDLDQPPGRARGAGADARAGRPERPRRHPRRARPGPLSGVRATAPGEGRSKIRSP